MLALVVQLDHRFFRATGKLASEKQPQQLRLEERYPREKSARDSCVRLYLREVRYGPGVLPAVNGNYGNRSSLVCSIHSKAYFFSRTAMSPPTFKQTRLLSVEIRKAARRSNNDAKNEGIKRNIPPAIGSGIVFVSVSGPVAVPVSVSVLVLLLVR